MASFGPVETFGYPSYYRDSTGLGLDLCLSGFDDRNGDPTGFDPFCLPLDGVDFGSPLSIPDNFPDEAFYWSADAAIDSSGISAILVLATEAAFGSATGAPEQGQQIVFGRVRVRLFGGVPGQTYTFTHPYGEISVDADANGFVTFTDDVLTLPIIPPIPGLETIQFEGALNAQPGPWLVWDPISAAPPGYVGNPNIPHRVTGSPCGQNFFRIDGPGLPVGGAETDLFNVGGRIAKICGNGVLDSDEECDDGNNFTGDCCDAACDFELGGTVCDDGNPCTNNTGCDGQGVCLFSSTNPGSGCDDGDTCTTGDTCDASGSCIISGTRV